MAAHIRTSARQSLVQTRLRPCVCVFLKHTDHAWNATALMNSRASANEMPPTDHTAADDGEMGRD